MPENQIPVSVVVPFFDGHATIDRTIASVARQTLLPLEVLVVDDGSVTPLAPSRLAAPLAIRIIRHTQNRGIPAARNTGIRAARGEWIAFLDHDDEWLPRKLERQWRALGRAELPGDIVVYGRCEASGDPKRRGWIYPSRRSMIRYSFGVEAAVRELVVYGNMLPFNTVLVHRSAFERFGYLEEDITGGADDYEMILRFVACGLSLLAAVSRGEPSAVWHATGRNYSSRAGFIEGQRLAIARLAEQYPLVRALSTLGMARLEFEAGRHHHLAGDHCLATLCYQRAIALRPGWWKPRCARLLLAAPEPAGRWLERALQTLRQAQRML